MSASATDEELVALVIATKDRNAFGELVRRHQGLVRSMMARMSGNRAMADDLAQDAFIRAFTKIGSFTGKGSFKSWLCSIAYREFLMARRKREAADRALEKLTREQLEDSEAPRDAGARIDLDRAMKHLNEQEKSAVVLCYACGFSHSEIAETMDAPLGTVKSWVNRGREKMKEALGDHVPA